jgi:hypothetical protein
MSETSTPETVAHAAPAAPVAAPDTAPVGNAALAEQLNAMVAPNAPDGVPAGTAAQPNAAEIEQARQKLAEEYQSRERIALQMQANPKPTIVEPVIIGTLGTGASLYATNRGGNVADMAERMIEMAKDAAKNTTPDKASEAIKNVAAKFVKSSAVGTKEEAQVLDKVATTITKMMHQDAKLINATETYLAKNMTGIKDFKPEKAASDLIAFFEKTVKKGGEKVTLETGKEVLKSLHDLKSEDVAKAMGIKHDALPSEVFQTIKDNSPKFVDKLQATRQAAEDLAKTHIGEKMDAGKVSKFVRTMSDKFDALPGPALLKGVVITGGVVAACVGIKALLDIPKNKQHEENTAKLSQVDRLIAQDRKALEALEKGGAVGMAL